MKNKKMKVKCVVCNREFVGWAHDGSWERTGQLIPSRHWNTVRENGMKCLCAGSFVSTRPIEENNDKSID